ncbi:hypothetical protein KAU55_00205 [Candidatus Bathyarchaeota archaeon]|nr:hypothetical protein [Candidatus Bathyarchaeota archaeon]
MSIIIKKRGEKVYKTRGFMSSEDKQVADNLDDFLQREVPKMEERIEQMELLNFKSKPGAIKLWYSVGKELKSLWDRAKKSFNLPDTQLPIFLKAVYDHSDKIRPGSGRSERFRNAHFYYCFIMASYSWKKVEAAGNWRAWVEFLDSKRIRNDLRIVEWFASRYAKESSKAKSKCFRKITRAIRNEFKEIDTTVLEQNELFQRLDSILNKINIEKQSKIS